MLSIIIPAYNERNTIPIVLKMIKSVPLDKEIIVVDDGSSDGTKEYLESLDDPIIKVVFHPKNLGKGAAVRRGVQCANALPSLFGSLDKSVGHYRRYTKEGLLDLLRRTGFLVETINYFNFLGAIGWFLNSRILRRESFSQIQVWFFDRFVLAL